MGLYSRRDVSPYAKENGARDLKGLLKRFPTAPLNGEISRKTPLLSADLILLPALRGNCAGSPCENL